MTDRICAANRFVGCPRRIHVSRLFCAYHWALLPHWIRLTILTPGDDQRRREGVREALEYYRVKSDGITKRVGDPGRTA